MAAEHDTGPILELEGMNISYRGDIAAVRDVSLRCAAGTITLILGPNGAGKTSLLRALTGFLRSEQVKVSARKATFEGKPFLSDPPDVRVGHGVVLVPERTKVFATLTVEENLRLIAARQGSTREEVDAIFPALAPLHGRKAGLLSGGERQMLAIGRALLARPKLLAIDELSLGLAPRLTGTLLEAVRQINQTTGMTIVLVEQAARAALKIADAVYVMQHGGVVWSGAAAEMPQESAFEAVYMSKAEAVE